MAARGNVELVEDGNRGVTEGRAEDVRADGAFLSSGGRVQRDLTVAAINAFVVAHGVRIPMLLGDIQAQCGSGPFQCQTMASS